MDSRDEQHMTNQQENEPMNSAINNNLQMVLYTAPASMNVETPAPTNEHFIGTEQAQADAEMVQASNALLAMSQEDVMMAENIVHDADMAQASNALLAMSQEDVVMGETGTLTLTPTVKDLSDVWETTEEGTVPEDGVHDTEITQAVNTLNLEEDTVMAETAAAPPLLTSDDVAQIAEDEKAADMSGEAPDPVQPEIEIAADVPNAEEPESTLLNDLAEIRELIGDEKLTALGRLEDLVFMTAKDSPYWQSMGILTGTAPVEPGPKNTGVYSIWAFIMPHATTPRVFYEVWKGNVDIRMRTDEWVTAIIPYMENVPQFQSTTSTREVDIIVKYFMLLAAADPGFGLPAPPIPVNKTFRMTLRTICNRRMKHLINDLWEAEHAPAGPSVSTAAGLTSEPAFAKRGNRVSRVVQKSTKRVRSPHSPKPDTADETSGSRPQSKRQKTTKSLIDELPEDQNRVIDETEWEDEEPSLSPKQLSKGKGKAKASDASDQPEAEEIPIPDNEPEDELESSDDSEDQIPAVAPTRGRGMRPTRGGGTRRPTRSTKAAAGMTLEAAQRMGMPVVTLETIDEDMVTVDVAAMKEASDREFLQAYEEKKMRLLRAKEQRGGSVEALKDHTNFVKECQTLEQSYWMGLRKAAAEENLDDANLFTERIRLMQIRINTHARAADLTRQNRDKADALIKTLSKYP
ncbi:hypothetical protein BDV95DRAFT_588479 [Massariosphaeria phaeospora]|uniref:Uncharacterized protein n=1 Tax=Massariosphaeria phaeospora TaxID=100035 RepID=A0A7C8HY90_9PLEO|nr:hypothetical protein BDV95DRAFT_588479 [Massariosphaeria phaeospora]